METAPLQLAATIPEGFKGLRLDAALAKCFPDHSRMRITQWIKANQVKVDGVHLAPKIKVEGGESVVVEATIPLQHTDKPEAIAIDILFEDDAILVLNKPAGLVVHPASGNREGTLLNALLHHSSELATLPRAGIVHRLDKDTTGVMVVAKNLVAHTALVAALQAREIERSYAALVGVELIAGKSIDAPIGRHPTFRTKMAVNRSGKEARTHFRCAKRFDGFTLLDVSLETGRTHQIRVHLSHIGCPIVGDGNYGWRFRVPPQSPLALQDALKAFKRQALHAKRLVLNHPITGESMCFEAPLPDDFKSLLSLLKVKTEYNHAP